MFLSGLTNTSRAYTPHFEMEIKTPPTIAIIGAGPGGCMLARLLLMQNIPCTIFEGEPSIDYRSQGGTLDLRARTGLAAIKRANLWDEFQEHARYDGESLLLTDKHLTTWMRRSPSRANTKQKSQDAPEIDRSDLRRILIDSLPLDCIKWNMRLARVDCKNTIPELHFVNGHIERNFDIIVGAEGAWSKVRSLLSDEKPFYAGLGGWTMLIPDAERTAPDVYKLVNRGSVFAFSDGKSMSLQQLSSGSIWVSTYDHFPEDYNTTCGFDPSDLTSVKTALKERLHNWDSRLLDAIEHTQGNATWRSLYMLPVGFAWPHRHSGVTLLGDAAHLMTPFAGIGVNTAFQDAMLLADEFAFLLKPGSGCCISQMLERYEKKMFKNAHKAQETTEGTMNDMLFTPGAPRTSIESWILRFAKEELPVWSHSLLTLLVYGVFWVYKWFV